MGDAGLRALGRRHALVLAGSLALVGCMLAPTADDQPLARDDQPVAFSGGTVAPSQEIVLRARNATGRFVAFHTTTGDADPPFVAMDGSRFYTWGATVPVPAWAWQPIGTSCQKQAFVQAAGRFGALVPFLNFDDAAQTCSRAAVDSGRPVWWAVTTCGSTEPVRLVAGRAEVHTGDIVIRTQADADSLGCTQRIVGNLTIESEPLEIALPASLVEVTGNLVMSVGYVEMRPYQPRVSIPALARVGGSVTLVYRAMPRAVGFAAPVTFDLPALTNLGGDITVDMQQFNGIPQGLSGLTEVPGNLTLSWRSSSEAYAGGLLDNLRRIHGSLRMHAGHNSGSILSGLRRVDGDVRLLGNYPGGALTLNQAVLPALETVSGQLVLDSVGLPGTLLFGTPFGALSRVGGGLSLRDVDGLAGPLGSPAGLTIGSLSLTDSAIDRVPLRLAPLVTIETPPIRITGNPNLCDSLVGAFVAALPAAVRAGTETSGNRPGC